MQIIKEPVARVLNKHISVRCKLDKASLKKFLSENYPLISILIGFMLVALSIGPYHNGDTAWEYNAVSGVIKSGLPYANGYLMDQPPVGFYIQAIFFEGFGYSINNGTFLVTLFGLGCVILVYGIGKAAYNKTTGFFAAMLFAFSPWHLILSRSFLIDTQCLFFSLLSLFLGVIAVKKGSLKLFFASGIIFAAAFNTKLYAVFMLIPILTYFLYYRPKNPKNLLSWFFAFSLPVLLISFLWYQVITGQGMASIFLHTDFTIYYPSVDVPTNFFVTNFLINYGLGWFFIDAAILALLVSFAKRSTFRKFLLFDLISLAVIVCIISVNTTLGAGLNLNAPYLNAIKYDYQSLPFFCFLAATLVTKGFGLVSNAKTKRKVAVLIAVIGLILVTAAIIYNMRYVHLISTSEYLVFKVDPSVTVGYSLFNSAPIGASSLQMSIQYLGYAIAISGLIWLSRNKLASMLKLSKQPKK